MAIVGSRPTAELQLAIMQQDQAILVSIPGIGRKLAERVIFELKEKVAAAGVAAAGSVLGGPVGDGDVVGALQALGYSLRRGARGSAGRVRRPKRRRFTGGPRQDGAPGARPGLGRATKYRAVRSGERRS